MERTIKSPEAILSTIHYVINKTAKKYYRNGIELEKNAIITPRRVDKQRELYETICHYWSIYPDCYLRTITPTTSKFRLKFFQVLFIRVCLRHGRILTIAPRAAGKSFICILAMYLICIFRPHSHVFDCAPGKEQSAKIAQAKIKQLWTLLPLLKEEIVGEGNMGTGYMTLTFRNGSIMDILTPLASTRGNRATAGIIDEYRLRLMAVVKWVKLRELPQSQYSYNIVGNNKCECGKRKSETIKMYWIGEPKVQALQTQRNLLNVKPMENVQRLVNNK